MSSEGDRDSQEALRLQNVVDRERAGPAGPHALAGGSAHLFDSHPKSLYQVAVCARPSGISISGVQSSASVVGPMSQV